MLLRGLAVLALACSVIATAAVAEDSISNKAPGATDAGPKITKEVLIAQSDTRYVEVCNKSGQKISVATATSARETNSRGQDLFTSRGWYTLGPGECEVVYDAPLINRWYYVYAESERSTWAGTFPFCVSKTKFTIKDVQCGEGYERRSFNRIDMNDDPGQPVRYSFTN